jgi:N-acetylneuraminic acid mutarotase
MKKLLSFSLFLLLTRFAVAQQSWIALPDFPAAERDDAVAFRIDDDLYMGSGLLPWFAPSKDFYRFNTINNQWSATAELPGEVRQYAFAFSFASSAYVFAGIGPNGIDLKDGYRFVPQVGWNPTSNYPGNGAQGIAAASTLSHGFAGMGRSNLTTLHNDWWQFNPASQTWTAMADFPGEARYLASCFESNSDIIITGGFNAAGQALNDCWAYLPDQNTWITKSNTPFQSRANAKAVKLSYHPVLCGGYDENNLYFSDCWMYQPDADNWQWLGNLPQGGRKGHVLISKENTLYAGLGIDSTNQRWKDFHKTDVPSSLHANFPSSFSAQPNPFENILFIQLQNSFSPTQIMIFDVQGRLVYSTRLINNNQSIDLEWLQTGMYLLMVNNGMDIQRQTLIKR